MIIFILFLIFIGVDINDSAVYEQSTYFWIGGIIALHWIIISVKAGAARLQDCDHTGGWMLLVVFLSFAAVFPLVLLFMWPGSNGSNNFGNPTLE